jgi:carbonic anhydrase/acetyltransferase-like protein (isoleucine patch superfamily)
VQDNAVLHADPGFPLVVGTRVTVGHQVMLHGCTIGDGSLIGIQAIVMNGAVIGRQCLVGAGAIVTEGKEFPDNTLIVGAPARAVREVNDKILQLIDESAQFYVNNWQRYRKGLRKIG